MNSTIKKLGDICCENNSVISKGRSNAGVIVGGFECTERCNRNDGYETEQERHVKCKDK